MKYLLYLLEIKINSTRNLQLGDKVILKANQKEGIISGFNASGRYFKCDYSDDNGVIHTTNWLDLKEVEIPKEAEQENDDTHY